MYNFFKNILKSKPDEYTSILLINEVKSSEANAASLAKVLSRSNMEITFEKVVNVKINNLLGVKKLSYSTPIVFTAEHFSKVIADKENYNKVINILLKFLTDGIKIIEDFGNNAEQYEKSARDFCQIYYNNFLEKEDPLYNEMQEFYTELYCLVQMNSVFSCSQLLQHFKKSGEITKQAKVGFPEFEPHASKNSQNILDDMKKILSDLPAMKEKLRNNPNVLFEAKMFALGTMDGIEVLVKKYEKIFEDGLQNQVVQGASFRQYLVR